MKDLDGYDSWCRKNDGRYIDIDDESASDTLRSIIGSMTPKNVPNPTCSTTVEKTELRGVLEGTSTRSIS